MSGTVDKQFEGDQKGNRQVEGETGARYGTPAHSVKGNPPNARREHDTGAHKGGENAKEAGGILGLERAERTMDSPVPEGAPHFDDGKVRTLNEIAAGEGAHTSHDDIDAIGGVMSRGMDEHGESGDNEG
jgi:hypothetical protein